MRTLFRSRRFRMGRFKLGIFPLEKETSRYAPIYDVDVENNRNRYPSERVCKLDVTLDNVKIKYILCLYVLYMT